MKIAFIAVKGMPLGGGIEKYTEELGSRLVKKGHKVIVYCSPYYGTKKTIYRGMDIKILPCINSRNLQKISLCLLASLNQFLEKNIDIVHYHAVGPSIFSFLPRILKRKTIVQIHGLEWKRPKWGHFGKLFFKLSDFSAIYFPNKVTAVSKVLKRYYEKKFGRKVVYIPTGVNRPKKRLPNKIKKFGINGNDYIFFAARLVPDKGCHYLIDAFNELKTDLKLVIAGDAPYEEAYKKSLYQNAKKNKNIIFTGFIHGKLLEEFFSNAYIYVLPSEIEGLSTSLLEAMSYGNCCVVSDIPENLEALGGFGYTFKAKDYKDLQKCLQMLINNPDLVYKKKRNVAKYVLKHYCWDKIADKFERLYYEMLES